MEPVTYDLVSLGRVGLPADAQLEDCTMTRFYSGGLQVTDDGSWQISLQVHDAGRRLGLPGRRRGRGGRRRVLVRVRRVRLQPTKARSNGAEVSIMYDWCYDGVPDVQLVFDR